MTTFSIASILGDQNDKHVDDDDDDEEENRSIDEKRQLMFNSSVQHLYTIFCKNAAVAAASVRLNEQHQNKTNLMRTFPMSSSAPPSNEFYPMHKLNGGTYPGKPS